MTGGEWETPTVQELLAEEQKVCIQITNLPKVPRKIWLCLTDNCRPPQSWYDEDFEGL